MQEVWTPSVRVIAYNCLSLIPLRIYIERLAPDSITYGSDSRRVYGNVKVRASYDLHLP